MRSWTDIRGRQEAVIDFCQAMEKEENAQKRADCCAKPEYAREQFALIGGYYLEGRELPGQPPNDGKHVPIPAKAEFRIFDFEDQAKDDLVTIVLPERGEEPQPLEVWRCSWFPWLA